MSDNSSKPPPSGIPAWQRGTPVPPPTASDSVGSSPPGESPNHGELLDPETEPTTTKTTTAKDQAARAPRIRTQDEIREQVKKFLQDDAVREAPTERKIAFLESEGLSRADVEKAMALLESEKRVAGQVLDTPSEMQRPQPDLTTQKAEQPPQAPPRDITPIITYPEFLLQAHKPPPLVTTQRLINTAYATSAAAALIYGLSHFLITPMTERLTAARHDFAQNAQSRIEELNELLAGAVSVDPKRQGGGKHGGAGETDGASEADTVDSDPTELFHRDFGTQTSPQLAAGGTPAAGSDSGADDEVAGDTVTQQTSQVQSLESLCKTIIEENAAEGGATQEVTSSIDSLKQYLDSLIYPTYSSSGHGSGIYGGTGIPEAGKKEDDEMARLKSEIRGVKGVLLSARNFPGGGRRQYWPAVGSS